MLDHFCLSCCITESQQDYPGTLGTPSFSMTKAVEDVSQHSSAQVEALKENQMILGELQASLSKTEKNTDAAEQQLRSTLREILITETEMDNLQRRMGALWSCCASISVENTQLQVDIREQEEEAAAALEEFATYRNKMQAHRAAAALAACHTQEYKVLEEGRALVRRLTQQREELRENLDKGNMVQREKVEAEVLEKEVSRKRRTVMVRRSRLQEELQSQAQIRKDIEIQNKRCEAITKRRRCQLSRAQAEHRQLSEEIRHLEKQLVELKRVQGSQQDQ